MGCVQSQVSLVRALEAWEAAERAALMFPSVSDQQTKADRLHAALARLCFACGYQPGRQHMNLSVVDFARQRAAVIRRVFPNHLKAA